MGNIRSGKFVQALAVSQDKPKLRTKYRFWRKQGLHQLCSMRMALRFRIIALLFLVSIPALAQHTVTLTATPAANTTGCNFYRSTVSGGPYATKVNSSPVTPCTTVDSNVVYGSSYFYVATDLNAGGESGYSNQQGVVIPKAVSATALTASATNVVQGTSVTFTSTVTSPAGTPTGTVNFLDGTTSLDVATLASGTASFSTSSLAVGTHNITAQYSGDAQNAASTSSVVVVTVTQAPPLPPTNLTVTVN